MTSIFADELFNKQILKRLNREIKKAQIRNAISSMDEHIKDLKIKQQRSTFAMTKEHKEFLKQINAGKNIQIQTEACKN